MARYKIHDPGRLLTGAASPVLPVDQEDLDLGGADGFFRQSATVRQNKLLENASCIIM